jgi:hypothetical protein
MKGLKHPASAVAVVCAALIAGGASYAAEAVMSVRRLRAGCLAALVAGASLGLASSSVAAVSVDVPCSGPGGGGGGLVAAVTAANASGGGSINLVSGCTYLLTSANNSVPLAGNNALPRIRSEITINGRGATIAGNGGNFRLIAVLPTGTLTLNGLTLTGGNNEIAGGGALLNHGTTTLNSVQVTGNMGFGGGGIANGPGPHGTPGTFLTINKSEVDHNTATGGFDGGGGGVANGGTLVLNNSEVRDNDAPGGPGGGVLNHGVATVNNTEVTSNTAAFGAGIFTADFGIPFIPVVSLMLNNSQVNGNVASVAAGGIAASGAITLHHTDVSGNSPDNCEPPGTIAGCTG